MKTFFKNNYFIILKLLLTVYILYALKYLFFLKHIESEFYMNITFLFTVVGTFLLTSFTLDSLKNNFNKRLFIISSVTSIYLCFVFIVGTYYEGNANYNGSWYDLYKEIPDFTFMQLKESLIYIPALYILFLGFIIFLFTVIPALYKKYINKYEIKEMPFIFNSLWKIWAFIFICWLPYFILLYPGYIMLDAGGQIAQLKEWSFNAHHPVFTTLYMYFIVFYYKISNNGVLSLALYVLLFQMLPLSFVYSYMIHKLRKIYDINTNIIIILIIFTALYPANPLTSIVIEKGVVFIIFFILFFVNLINLIENPNLFKNKKFLFLLILIGAIFCLTRHNVIYGLFFSLPFLLILSRKYIKRFLFVFICIVISFFIFNEIIMELTNAKKGPINAAMSVPVQQLTRVYKLKNNELNENEKKFIENMMNDKNKLLDYHTKISDPVVFNTKSNIFLTENFIKDYIKLGFKYPNTYFNSFLIISDALWYPFNNQFWLNGLMLYDLDQSSINIKVSDLSKHKKNIINDYISKTQISVTKNNSMAAFVLINQSFLFYILVFSFLYFIYRKSYKEVFILTIILGYTATVFLGPIIYFRYTYYLAAFLPILIMMLTKNNKQNDNTDDAKAG